MLRAMTVGIPPPPPRARPIEALQTPAMQAASLLWHTLFTGLILTVASRRNAEDAGRWTHALFRAQHHEKFLSSFAKLGLSDMPPAVAAAAYHYLSNRIGGVDVEFMRESDTKAWVRFPPPRWVYPGATICGVPPSVSRGMLTGWYAENGVSLGVEGLQFVATGQTPEGQPGLAGYFIDRGRSLAPDERLIFRPGEVPPPFDPKATPEPPAEIWTPDRLGRARRNYAMEYHRTGWPLIFQLFGPADGYPLLRTACWLTGVQMARECARLAGVETPGELLVALAEGEGASATLDAAGGTVRIRRRGNRLTRGLEPQPHEFALAWAALHEGLVAGLDRFAVLELSGDLDEAEWSLTWPE